MTNFYELGKMAAEENYGMAPMAGTLGKLLPIPFSGPLAAGLTAGIEGEGRDTDESLTRGLYAGGGNLLGSAAGSALGGLGGGLAGGLAALPLAMERKRQFGFFGPKKMTLDPDVLAMLLPAMAGGGAALGGGLGNIVGGHKGTKWGIKKHREAEAEREKRTIEKHEGRKNKAEKDDE